MNRLTRKLSFVVASLILGIAGTLPAATSASAASGDKGLVPAFSSIYKCPWSACSYWVTSYDTWFPLDCWQDSQMAPYGRFFYIYTVGWVKAAQVLHQPSVPRC